MGLLPRHGPRNDQPARLSMDSEAQQHLLRGRGPSASEALLHQANVEGAGIMPTYAVPFIDENLRAEVEFFRQWGFLVRTLCHRCSCMC